MNCFRFPSVARVATRWLVIATSATALALPLMVNAQDSAQNLAQGSITIGGKKGYRNFKRPFSLFLNVSDEPRAVKRSRVD